MAYWIKTVLPKLTSPIPPSLPTCLRQPSSWPQRLPLFPDQLIITNAGGFPVGVDVDNILTVNSMPRCKLITEVLQKAGFIEKSGQGVDKMFYHCLMDGKCLPDYSLTDEWQVCLRLPGEIKYPAFMLYARE